ncbi:hypothetical protein C9426_09780 [Serratia sp. S1B]|nr:hypothetical protein C9426_09780 [Serratia sp. S1B]
MESITAAYANSISRRVKRQLLCLTQGTVGGMALFMLYPAFATDYTVFPGSVMQLITINGQLSGGVGTITTSSAYSPRMAGGGLTTASVDSTCQTPVTVNGYTGTRAVSARSDIVVGVTGTSTGARVNIGSTAAEVSGKQKIYAIAGNWDQYGKISSSSASAESLSRNCLYPAGAPSSGTIYYSGAANANLGNVPATLNLNVWAYIGPNVPYGTYNLTQLFFRQGVTTGTESLAASRAILVTGDRLIVRAPPCSLSVGKNAVTFTNLSTSSNMSASVSDNLTVNCTGSSVTAKAYVRATGITGTTTADQYGLGLINSDTKESKVDGTGIIIRGELGNSPAKNCSAGNAASSVLFNPQSLLPGYYLVDLAATDRNVSIPLQWYACTTAKTVPGSYTGAVTLGITYQ